MNSIEDVFLNKAAEGGLSVRLTLGNRERLTGRLTEFCRQDVGFTTAQGSMVIPKKDITSISSPDRLVEPAGGGAEDKAETTRSRVQDEFLGRYVKDRTLSLVSMVNGDELRGVPEGYDGFTVLVRSGRGQTLLYKHGIMSIGPGYRRTRS